MTNMYLTLVLLKRLLEAISPEGETSLFLVGLDIVLFSFDIIDYLSGLMQF